MAINLTQKYGSRVDDTDTTYPYGKILNKQGESVGSGTPLDSEWANDIFGLLQSILVAADITPSGNADSVGDSEYLNGLKHLISLDRSRLVPLSGGGTINLLYGNKVTDSASYIIPLANSVLAGTEVVLKKLDYYKQHNPLFTCSGSNKILYSGGEDTELTLDSSEAETRVLVSNGIDKWEY